MKKIIFSELKFSTFFMVLILKIFFSKVYFLQISKLFRNIYLLKILKLLNIHWLSYQDNNRLYNYTKYRSDSIKFSRRLAKKLTIKLWNKEFKKVFFKKKYFYIALHKVLKRRSDEYTELIRSSKIIKSKKSEKIYFWVDKNFISSYIFSQYPDHSNIKLDLSYFLYFSLFSKYLIMISKLIILGIFKKILIRFSFNKKDANFVNSNNDIDTIKSEVLYFTHKGGDGTDIKDNIYYSKNKKNKFYHKNILHIEWFKADISDNNDVKNSYKKNEIRFTYWENYKTKLEEKMVNFFRLIAFVLNVKKRSDPLLIEIISILFFQINSAKIKIKKYFPNTKIVLVQYEYLFPVHLAIALKAANIKIISAQTRMIMPLLGESYLCDVYLVLGKKSLLEMKKQINKPEIALLGMKNYNLAKKNKLKTKKIKHIFVYDVKSSKDWYENGRFADRTWKENYLFYSMIVEKAQLYKDTLFYIKGKNYDWMNIAYFKKILLQIKKQKNIIILNKSDKEQILNYQDKADLFLAIYTSAVDQALANGKPVIIYNLCHDIFCNYKNLEAKSKKQLDILLNNFHSNYYRLNLQINKIRKHYYSKSNILKVRSMLDKY